MRDAATAADMSDPTLNRWFRRRWAEKPDGAASPPPVGTPPLDEKLANTGLALLHEWRRQRDATAAPR